MTAFTPSRRFFLKGAAATAALVPVAAPGLAKVTPAADPFIEKLIKSMSSELNSNLANTKSRGLAIE